MIDYEEQQRRDDIASEYGVEIVVRTKLLVIERGIATDTEFDRWSNDGCDSNDPTGNIWIVYQEVLNEFYQKHS
jgi:hypothetical protein